MSPADLERWLPAAESLVHISGITPALSTSCLALVETLLGTARPRGVRVLFDVNHRPRLWAPEVAAPVLLALARQADTVFVGLDEAQTLWGTATADDVRRLIGGTGVLVVKDAAIGA